MNKKTSLKLLVLLIIPVIYFLVIAGFRESSESNSPGAASIITPVEKDFFNFILNPAYYDPEIYPWAQNEWHIINFMPPVCTTNLYRELNFTGVHMYDEPPGSGLYGKFDLELSGPQITSVSNLMNMVSGVNNDVRSVFERTKISRLCYGQRLVYEVSDGGSQTVNYGFCYQQCSGQYTTDGGRTVVHADPQVNNAPQYLCSNIYENMMHTDLSWFRPGIGDLDMWHAKPVMKIPLSVFDPYSETPVVTITALNFLGQVIKTVTIKVRNFRDQDDDYDGSYIDLYNFLGENPPVDLTVSGSASGGLNEGYVRGNINNCAVDFKVYWPGQVEVWFDKMVVDDQIGHDLFRGIHNDKIDDELSHFSDPNNGKTMDIYFADECSFSNISCIKYVQNYIRNYNQTHGTNAKLVYATSNNLNIYSRRNDDLDHAFWLGLDSTQPQYFQVDAHCLQFTYEYNGYGYVPNDAGLNLTDPLIPEYWKKNSTRYNEYLQRVLGDRNLTEHPYPYEGSFVFQVEQAQQQINRNITRLIVQPQIQNWSIGTEQQFLYGCREPLNEEIRVQAMLAIAHGAESLSWFWLPSGSWPEGQYYQYCYGLMTTPTQKRTSNLYEQNKWQYVCNLNSYINNLKPTLDQLYWLNAYSIHTEGANHGFITDIQSIPRNPTPPYEFNPVIGDQVKYWEMGFFEPSQPHFDEYIKYVMFVNRRCVPEEGNESHGDVRQLKIKFNPEMLLNYNNWKICDVLNPDNVKVFDKNSGNYVDLGSTPGSMGYFLPGEGKMFKLVPVFKSGGILVTNENIPGSEEFICEDTVFSGGYNITLEDGAKIHFTDTSTIIMSDSGTFTMGDAGHQGPPATWADAAPNCHWYGLNFSDCEVKIYSSKFEGLASDSAYAINIIDCPVVDVKSNTFNCGSSVTGGVSLTYYNSGLPPNVYIGANTFSSSDSSLPALNVMSYAGMTVPAIIEGNTFTASASNSTAITLSGIIGGAVKSNSFTGYGWSINALSSSIDVSGNIITSTVNSSFGIEALSGSEIKMNNAGELILGGRNDVNNTGDESNNILVNNSVFLIDNGENIFNIAGNVGSYHLYGFFPDTFSGSYEATKNCFKVDNTPVQPPVNYVTLGYQGMQIAFTFEPYLTGCTMGGEGEGLVIILGDGIYDTVGTKPGGGSVREMANSLPRLLGVKRKTGGSMIINPKVLYDSICIQMRFRNYGYVRTKCTEIINAYADSIYSLNAIPKLYLATSMTDTTSAGHTALKTYYENLILNHSNNTALVKRCNYYVQKCKVLLHQYTSALAGFEQIMLQNPYSYEGLVARWDHMATQLLIQGHGGGETPPNLPEGEEFFGGDDDRSPFMREQKIMITRSVNDALNTSRNADERRYIEVSKRSEQGNVEAKRELEVMKTLKEVVKPASPKNVFEHVKIVRHDMQRIFTSPATREAGKVNQLPTEFALSQNYPNPFNPITRINYDLPKDSKVNLVIYDIIGREVKRLVNNEIKQAGRYTVEFNGTNLASGVYFYRIEAADYVMAKKMVLVK